MKLTRRTFGKVMGATLLTTPTVLRASAYPSRPINYVIPFNPGGESDVTARFQQPFLEKIAGESVVISSKPGAGGATAWAQLNGFEPDGHTIMGTIVPHIVLQPAMKDVGYQTENIENIFFFHYTPDAVVVKADSPYQTLQDLIDDAQSNPGRVTLGGSGTNTANHLASEIFGDLTKTVTTYVPFKGSAPAMTAVLGGQISAGMSYSTQGVKAGEQVRTLAVATEERIPALPDTPTFKELGLNHIGGAYRGVAVPKGTPADIKEKLSGMPAQVNAEPAFQKQMTDAGYAVVDVENSQVASFMEERKAAYAPAIARMKSS